MTDRPVRKKEIEITPEMIEAGIQEMQTWHLGQDPRLILEAIFYAMFFEMASASSSKDRV